MQTVRHLTQNVEYYAEEKIEGRAEYLAEGGHSPGRWVGSLAAADGLVGPADRDDLVAAFDRRHPNGGPLTVSNIRNAGFDLTLSPPKSISLLWALGTTHDSRQVEAAMHAARDEVERYLEANACAVRRGKAGASVEPATGFLGAVFQHRTSRMGDPDLHLHWIVSNVGEGPDGRRTALDGRPLHTHRYTADTIFQAVLRRELTTRLGVTFGPVDRHGAAEIAGIPDDVRRAFSKRRIQIEKELDRRGARSGDAARIAALTTRRPKVTGLTEGDLRVDWQYQAECLGFDIDAVPRGRAVNPALDVDDTDLARTLTESDATYSRQHVIRAVARHAPDGATLDQILTRTDQYLGSAQAVELADDLWTTPEMLALESAILDIADQPSTSGRRAAADAVAEALAARPTISDEQARMVTAVCESGRPVDAVVGRAGAGKTFTLDAVRAAFEARGSRVIGVCQSAAAARELTDGAGIASQTAAKLQQRIVHGKHRFRPDDVVVIDEAGLMGTRDLAFLIRHAHDVGAKVIVVGDHKQLPAIEAGGIFATLARRPEAIELTENRRQQDPAERAVVDHLRHHRSHEAVVALDDIGHITTADNADVLRDRMTTDWYRHHLAGSDALMGALRRADVRDLNRRAHAVLATDGQLGPPVLTIDDQEYSIGDRILATKNAYDLGILNGDTGTIRGFGDGQLTVETDKGLALDLPLDYVTEHIQHGYARTVHKSQGLTCDIVLILGGDDLYAELGYTGLTRARQENHLYAVAVEKDEALQDLIASLATSRAKSSAHDLAPSQPRGGVRRLLDMAGPQLEVG